MTPRKVDLPPDWRQRLYPKGRQVAQSWPVRTLSERFMEKVSVNETTGCWEWTAYIDPSGYGRFTVDGDHKAQLAHRVSYELHVGPIANGMTLDHLCRNRACANPSHLEQVTLTENKRRGESVAAINARKTHCKRGHEFTERNTRISKDGSRACRACGRETDPVDNCEASGCSNPIPAGARADRRTCSRACSQRRTRALKVAA